MTPRPSYDRFADWYDDWVHGSQSSFGEETERLLRELVGRGPGRLLDQGCGGGRFLRLFAELGWSVVGIDESEAQLRIARPRAEEVGADLVEGDATALPFEDESFDAVAAVLVSTDIEPWERLVSEAARVLRPAGSFVHVGTHPCLIGPHSVLAENGRRLIGPGYRERRRQFDLPAFQPAGIRARVGAVHVPLDDMLNALVSARLRIARVEEGRESDPPSHFGLRAEKR